MPILVAFALKNIKRRPLRTGILLFSIGLLVAALVFSLSFVRRVNSSIRIASERLGADLIVVPTGSRSDAEEVLLENRIKSFYMEGQVLDRVRAIEGVGAATQQTYLVTIAGVCCDVPESMIIAFDHRTDFIVRPWLSRTIDRPLEKGEAIVGHESAYNINLGLVNMDSTLFGNRFHMIGTLDKTGTGLDTAIFISDANMDDIIRNGRTKIKPGQISVIFIRVGKGVDPASVARRIEDSIIEVDAVSRKDIGKNIIATLRDMSRIFSITMFLAALLSLFLVWAIFSAIANERSREVGLLRALGAKESHVVELFFIEVLATATAGGLGGALFGSAFTLVLGNAFSILRNLSNDLSAGERVVIAAIAFCIGTLICLAGALAPIQRVKKLEPLMVIKQE